MHKRGFLTHDITCITFTIVAVCESSLNKISVTLDFLQHIIQLEESLFVDVDYLDETPALSQLETESEQEQDCYGMLGHFVHYM